jgi:lysozyme
VTNGIDVSDFQPGVSWQTVKEAGYSFAYCKATEGTGYVADTFAQNWRATRDAGILRGAYHFLHFDQDPTAQAEAFLATYSPSTGDLPPMLDIETDAGLSVAQNVSCIATFTGIVEAKVKRKMQIYTYCSFWQQYLGDTDDFSGHPLWIAAYVPAPPPLPAAWTEWTVWQYADDKEVPGAGAVDADLFNGNLDQLKGMCLP